MPIYEYRCLDCLRRFDIFMSYQEYGKKEITCKHCGSNHVTRKISRIRVLKGDDFSFDNINDMDSLENLEKDPVALGRMMRQMSGELGEEMPPEFDEVVDRLEKGQSPEEIEKELPDFGSGPGDSSGFDDGDL